MTPEKLNSIIVMVKIKIKFEVILLLLEDIKLGTDGFRLKISLLTLDVGHKNNKNSTSFFGILFSLSLTGRKCVFFVGGRRATAHKN